MLYFYLVGVKERTDMKRSMYYQPESGSNKQYLITAEHIKLEHILVWIGTLCFVINYAIKCCFHLLVILFSHGLWATTVITVLSCIWYEPFPMQASTELICMSFDSVASNIDWNKVDKLIEN